MVVTGGGMQWGQPREGASLAVQAPESLETAQHRQILGLEGGRDAVAQGVGNAVVGADDGEQIHPIRTEVLEIVLAPLGHHHAVAGGGLEGGAIQVGVAVGWIADQGKAAVVALREAPRLELVGAQQLGEKRQGRCGSLGEILEANIRTPSSIASVGLGPWCNRAAPKPRSAT